jgi:hypothetical protein
LSHVDGRTDRQRDTTKPRVAFRDFANAFKKQRRKTILNQLNDNVYYSETRQKLNTGSDWDATGP